MATEKRVPAKWIYVGRVVTSDNKLFFRFYEYDDFMNDPENAKGILFSKIRVKVVGGVYTGETSEDGETAYILNQWKYAGHLKDNFASPELQDRIVSWVAEDVAAYEEYKDIQAEKRDMGFDSMYERLEPIKRAYWRSKGPGRRAILLKVMSYIMGGKR